MNQKVAVVILNFNGKRFLERFLPGVIDRSKEIAEVIVADNASTDDSVDFLKTNFPEIRLIQNPTNGGFAAGYNRALKLIDTQYYVLLNSDIEVSEGWLQPLLELLESDTQIAACQPKLLSFADNAYFEYAGAAGGFIDKFGYPFCRGRLFQHVEKDVGQYDDLFEVFWASGACMFVRADLYHKFGGLDSDFFAHMEEIDFCWQLKNQGFKIMYCPNSVVYHIGGGTLPKNSPRKTYLNFRNNLSMLYKNLPPSFFSYVIITRLFLDGVASFKFLIEGGVGDFLAVLRAHLHFYRKLPALRAKRRIIQPKNVTRVFKKNIVIEYFIKKKDTFDQFDQRFFS
ncbi:MAG: dTDP-Rha--alpha-D-GlcNAc-pyrophosphate polyprenol alpha-3-L-rhamnosyltransferase [Bacteroidetes bacterium HGW-Bacteroidetes-1]|nr:MAG: dTDP-Rha--alpha-D-GlcNAc-pyrophosphate polyprenol alpha-3-L-rhamnosyltransferase [Bacteroidetes bacterium HGW-Bacteroidetes-1]